VLNVVVVGRFMLLADYESYIRCQERVSETYAVSSLRIYLLNCCHLIFINCEC